VADEILAREPAQPAVVASIRPTASDAT
jgi:hypothetical protein